MSNARTMKVEGGNLQLVLWGLPLAGLSLASTQGVGCRLANTRGASWSLR